MVYYKNLTKTTGPANFATGSSKKATDSAKKEEKKFSYENPDISFKHLRDWTSDDPIKTSTGGMYVVFNDGEYYLRFTAGTYEDSNNLFPERSQFLELFKILETLELNKLTLLTADRRGYFGGYFTKLGDFEIGGFKAIEFVDESYGLVVAGYSTVSLKVLIYHQTDKRVWLSSLHSKGNVLDSRPIFDDIISTVKFSP